MKNRGLKESAVQGVRWTGLHSLVSIVVGFAQISILGRLLIPEDFGLVALLNAIVGIAIVIVNLAFSEALIAIEKITLSQRSTLYWLNVTLGIVVFSTLYFIAPYVAKYFNQAIMSSMLQLIAVSVLLASLSIQFETLVRKNLYLKLLSISQSIAVFVAFIVATTAAYKGYGAWSLVFSTVAAQATKTIIMTTVAINEEWLPKFEIEIKEIKEFLTFGYFRIGAALVNEINSRADQLIVGAILGPKVLGYYAVSYQLVIQPFSRINPILTNVSFPVFAIAKNNLEKLRNGYSLGLRVLMAINAPLLVGLAVVAPVLLPLVLGEGWLPVVVVTQIMTFFVLLRSAGNVSVGLILAKGKYKWPFYWNLCLLMIIPGSIYVAVSLKNSLVAVCIALVMLQIFMLSMNYVLFIRRLLGNVFPRFIKDLSLPIIVALLMGTVVFISMKLIVIEEPIVLLVTLIFEGALIYSILSFFMQKNTVIEVLKILNIKV